MTIAPPKIVVVGGGPVGMTVAHALTRAGIDFVLLESRPSIAMAAGTSLVMSPIGLRALSQFGLLPAIEKAGSPCPSVNDSTTKDDLLETPCSSPTSTRSDHGCASRVISRKNLMQILLDGLPAESQSKLLPNKKISGLLETEDGVVVQCTDGTSYEGTMVIGADGAYSAVRKHMSAIDSQQGTQEPADKEELPYLTTYRCFWMRFRRLPGIEPGDMTESHGPQATTQYFAAEDTAVVAVYERLPEPTRRPPRHYSEADEAAFVARWGHLPLNNNTKNDDDPEGGATALLTLGQAYAHATQTGFINLEEGVVADWSRGGRAVLVGDAAHKFTPSTGAGCNNGIIDVVVLVNKLHKIFALASAGGVVASRDDLAAAFREYQDARFDTVTLGCGLSGRATANASWAIPWAKFTDIWIFSSNIVMSLFLRWAAGKTASTPVFDFIEGEEKVVGKYPWVHAIPFPQAKKMV
ncbi:uncharacterized protein PG998_014431 [Apiospora kogelbergensis]|uniref:uncharacterized protein n=1 Tax=Apiospora kogelbergensis TaxID=1337665 RepID=UPI003130B4D7